MSDMSNYDPDKELDDLHRAADSKAYVNAGTQAEAYAPLSVKLDPLELLRHVEKNAPGWL